MSFNKQLDIILYNSLIQTSEKIFWLRNVSFFGYYRSQNIKVLSLLRALLINIIDF